MSAFLYRQCGVCFECLQIGEILFPPVYLIGTQTVHEIGKDLDVEQIQSGPVNKRRQSERVDYPSDKNRIEIAEVRGHHYDGSLFCKLSQLLHFAYDMN